MALSRKAVSRRGCFKAILHKEQVPLICQLSGGFFRMVKKSTPRVLPSGAADMALSRKAVSRRGCFKAILHKEQVPLTCWLSSGVFSELRKKSTPRVLPSGAADMVLSRKAVSRRGFFKAILHKEQVPLTCWLSGGFFQNGEKRVPQEYFLLAQQIWC